MAEKEPYPAHEPAPIKGAPTLPAGAPASGVIPGSQLSDPSVAGRNPVPTAYPGTSGQVSQQGPKAKPASRSRK